MTASEVIFNAASMSLPCEKEKRIKYFRRSATAATVARSIKRFCHNFPGKLLS